MSLECRLCEFTSLFLFGLFPPTHLVSSRMTSNQYLPRGFGTLAATACSSFPPHHLWLPKRRRVWRAVRRVRPSDRCPRSLTSGQRDQWGAAFET